MSKTKTAPPKAISRTEVKAPGHLHLGELCPHYGGVFAGLVRGQDEKPDYYLFVPPDHTAQANLPWGGYEHDEPGAKDSHDGLANTIALCESKIDHPATPGAKVSIIPTPIARRIAALFRALPSTHPLHLEN